jgi:hypothetical protein
MIAIASTRPPGATPTVAASVDALGTFAHDLAAAADPSAVKLESCTR